MPSTKSSHVHNPDKIGRQYLSGKTCYYEIQPSGKWLFWSYTTRIAAWNGDGLVYVNFRYYSRTTANHKKRVLDFIERTRGITSEGLFVVQVGEDKL